MDIIKVMDRTARSALDLASSNYSALLIAENTEKVSSHDFNYQSVLEGWESLLQKNKKLKE